MNNNNAKITVISEISPYPAGESVRYEVTASAEFESVKNRTVISYVTSENGSQYVTELSFPETNPCCVTVKKYGAVNSEICFEKERFQDSVYETGGYRFDMTVYTKDIENEIIGKNGHIKISYVMELGGEKQSVVLTFLSKELF